MQVIMYFIYKPTGLIKCFSALFSAIFYSHVHANTCFYVRVCSIYYSTPVNTLDTLADWSNQTARSTSWATWLALRLPWLLFYKSPICQQLFPNITVLFYGVNRTKHLLVPKLNQRVKVNVKCKQMRIQLVRVTKQLL